MNYPPSKLRGSSFNLAKELFVNADQNLDRDHREFIRAFRIIKLIYNCFNDLILDPERFTNHKQA